MTFSDDDLKRLKEYTATAKWVSFTHDDVANLLARLEAAEKMCDYVGKVPDLKNMDWFIEGDKLFQAWRKAAGK